MLDKSRRGMVSTFLAVKLKCPLATSAAGFPIFRTPLIVLDYCKQVFFSYIGHTVGCCINSHDCLEAASWSTVYVFNGMLHWNVWKCFVSQVCNFRLRFSQNNSKRIVYKQNCWCAWRTVHGSCSRVSCSIGYNCASCMHAPNGARSTTLPAWHMLVLNFWSALFFS